MFFMGVREQLLTLLVSEKFRNPLQCRSIRDFPASGILAEHDAPNAPFARLIGNFSDAPPWQAKEGGHLVSHIFQVSSGCLNRCEILTVIVIQVSFDLLDVANDVRLTIHKYRDQACRVFLLAKNVRGQRCKIITISGLGCQEDFRRLNFFAQLKFEIPKVANQPVRSQILLLPELLQRDGLTSESRQDQDRDHPYPEPKTLEMPFTNASCPTA